MAHAEDGLNEQAKKVLDQARSIADSIVPGGSDSISPSAFLGGLVIGLTLWHVLAPSLVDETFGLVPHHTVFTVVGICPIPFVWNIATGHFYESSILKAAIAAPGVAVLARLLERIWTAKAIGAHVLFTVTCTGATFFLTELVHVYQTQHEKDFFIPVRGCIGLLVALSIGARYSYPFEPVPYLPRALGFQCQHLPFAITAIACFGGLVAPSSFTEWLFAPFAFFFGWLHLRYVMWFPHAQAHGDHSPDFLFASMFPRPFRPLVGCLGALMHGFVALVVPSFVQLRTEHTEAAAASYDPSRGGPGHGASADIGALGPSGAASVVPGGPGSAEYVARRTKALALLDRNIDALLAPHSGARDTELDEKISSLLAGRACKPRADVEAQVPAPAAGRPEALAPLAVSTADTGPGVRTLSVAPEADPSP